MTTHRRMRSRWGRTAVLVIITVAAALVLGAAGPASAHATLIGSDPAEGAVLEAAPERIRFTFDEAVGGVPDGVQVFDAQGGPVASSATVSGPELDVVLTEQVADGTLVVVWRVVSEDGHPISGSLTFSVGAPSASVKAPPSGSDATAEAPRLLSLTRWVGYVGLFLAAGLVGFALLLLPSSHLADKARRRLVTAARAGAATAVVAWLVALPQTAVYQLGGGAGALTERATWSALSPAEYGVTAAVVVGVVLAVGLLGRGEPTRPRRVAALVAGAVATCAPGLTGHTRAVTPEVLVVGADMLHLLAGSVWLGGLVALTLVLSDLAGRGTLAAEALARFSGVAAGILVALVITGSALTWRIVGSWSALVESGYGQLLLVKIAAALVAVGIASWNRYQLLPLLPQATRRRDRRAGARLVVRTTAAEAAVLVAVLLVAGILVDKSPEPDASVAAVDAEPAVETAALGEVDLQATVSSPATGPSTVTIEMQDAAGEPFEGLEAPRARLSSEKLDLGALPVRSVAPGTYSGEVVFPSPGTWRLQVSLRVSEFDNPVTTLEFTVVGG